MGNGCSKKKGPSRKLTLAIVGLDNAGKTVTTKGLQGENIDDVAPTIGFSNVDFKFDGNDITLYDLGGAKKIRDIWKSYLGEIYALIFVVDSADKARMDECRQVLNNLLGHDQMSGKPVLLLANKQDQNGALDEIDLCESLNLEQLVNKYKCPCRIERCSAIKGYGKKQDPAIRKGMTWLLQTIDISWEKLHERVSRDVADKKAREEMERAEKRERVRKIREERSRKEAEERKLCGEDDPTSDQEDVTDGGDPFKQLNYEKLKQKEQQMKAEKLKKKEIEKEPSIRGQVKDDDRCKPRLGHHIVDQGSNEAESDDETIPQQNVIRSSQSADNNLSRLHSKYPQSSQDQLSPRLDHKLELLHDDMLGPVHRSPRPLSLQPMSSLSSRSAIGEGEKEAEARVHSRRMLAPLTPLGPIETPESGKKKKHRKNKTVPLQETDETRDYHPKMNPFTQRGWETPPAQRNLLRASRTPALETLKEPESDRSDPDNMDSFTNKWGLDLPELTPTSRGTLRPNYDHDDIIT